MKTEKKATIIIQARTGSTRYPGKVLAEIEGKPLIEYLIERLKRSISAQDIILATTANKSDDKLEQIAQSKGIKCVRGEENNVLSRYKKATEITDSEVLVRITGDCPLIDVEMLDKMVEHLIDEDLEYYSNCEVPTYADGLDIEVFKKDLLLEANENAISDFDKEHVTTWIKKKQGVKKGIMKYKQDLSHIRLTVDEYEDIKVIRKLLKILGTNEYNWEDIVEVEKKNPNIFKFNRQYKRNEGAAISSGQKVWKRAKAVIPGGNMLLSKRPEIFLPDKWPTYYKKAKGCRIWDLDNRELIDMSVMGVGTNILGYANEEVDESVIEAIRDGNMSTLNCTEEVLLAEKLVGLHPWSDMVRFARSGGEANAIAIRIARAATGKSKVAVCGYHGWHDWYLATNLKGDTELKEHLLPGLKPEGVPKELEGTVIPFKYNDINQIKQITSDHDLAAIKMEVERNMPPDKGYLDKIRKICTEKGIVLIFDECTSVFRETNGGLHKKYGVEPDMAMFGKALGNGYAITAIIGREQIMQSAQQTFISSTFWTERIGPTAAIKTLAIMEREQSWKIITERGKLVKEGWSRLASRYGIDINIGGLAALSTFNFKGDSALVYKTYLSQAMLDKGYLAGTSCYLSTSHTVEIITKYLEELEDVFVKIADCENEGTAEGLLEGPVCHTTFKRLN